MAKIVGIGVAIMLVVLMAMHNTVLSHSEPITAYALVIPDGPNPNIIPVAGNPNQPINTTRFGTVSVFDVPSTEGVNPNSPLVIRSQGIQVISSMDGKRVYFSFSNHFVHGKYKGSTLEVQGTVGLTENGYDGEIPVVGGTNFFRGVTGYLRLRTVQKIPGTNNVVNKVEFFLKCLTIPFGG